MKNKNILNTGSNFRASLTEMSVLLDVLNIAKRKGYMVLDQVSQPTPEPKSAIQLASKKRVSSF